MGTDVNHKYCREINGFDQASLDALMHYEWPGNVRELDNVMQRALILQPGNVIEADDLGLQAGELYS